MNKALSQHKLKLMFEKLIANCFHKKLIYDVEEEDVMAILKSLADATVVKRNCKHCGSEFLPSRDWQWFCSLTCAQKVRSMSYVTRRLALQPKRKSTPILERFMQRVEKANGCWLWQGPINNNGYPRFMSEAKKTIYAHRWAYERWNGSLKDGDMVHHLCQQRTCVNPEHLQAVSRAEHVAMHQPQLDYCKRGHEMSGDNTYLTGYNTQGIPRRGCRKCRTAARLRSQQQSTRGLQ